MTKRQTALGWGRTLDRLIRAAGFATLTDVADYLGVHEGTVRHWRRGRQTPVPAARQRYEELLRDAASNTR
jgi:hypothetical protein